MKEIIYRRVKVCSWKTLNNCYDSYRMHSDFKIKYIWINNAH